MLSSELESKLAAVARELDAGAATDNPVIAPGFRARILRFLSATRAALYPTIFAPDEQTDRLSCLTAAATELNDLVEKVLPDASRDTRVALCADFFEKLPEVAALLRTDVQAAYEGDPAARSAEEIMLAYPAFEAISIYRVAHVLFTLGLPLVPRMMTEYAHKNTGIDIHPGATIGAYFFIDHGTGVVIGETCRIGERVKLYQGVTLGAKSFDLDENGNPVKGIKRHPDIGDRVIVYANATILGGNTVIGDGAVIGASVWLTHSVAAGETVYYDKGQ